MPSIEQVLDEKSPALMDIAGVTGVGQGATAEGTECIVVMVARSSPEVEDAVRSVMAGHPFRIEVTGEFRAQPE